MCMTSMGGYRFRRPKIVAAYFVAIQFRGDKFDATVSSNSLAEAIRIFANKRLNRFDLNRFASFLVSFTNKWFKYYLKRGRYGDDNPVFVNEPVKYCG